MQHTCVTAILTMYSAPNYNGVGVGPVKKNICVKDYQPLASGFPAKNALLHEV